MLLCAMALMLAGCEPEMYTTPLIPGQIALLTITFNPDPAPEGYGDTCTFVAFIDEVNGVGATIDSIKIEYVNDAGIVFKTDNWGYYQIMGAFGTNRIEAFGRMRGQMGVDNCSSCDRQYWLVRADDDYGNHVEYTGTIQFLSR